MAKVISLNNYIDQKNSLKKVQQPSTNSIWFSDICEAIIKLARKDQDLIFKNIRYHYYSHYIEFFQQCSKDDYSFHQFLKDHLPLTDPFTINHGVDFSGAYSINRLTHSDWENIADMIVRISLSYTLWEIESGLNPEELALQYEWDHVMVDSH